MTILSTLQAAGSKLSSSAQPKAKAASKAEDSGTRSLKLTERFYARPRDLYECFTDARRLQGFTQSPAKVCGCRLRAGRSDATGALTPDAWQA